METEAAAATMSPHALTSNSIFLHCPHHRFSSILMVGIAFLFTTFYWMCVSMCAVYAVSLFLYFPSSLCGSFVHCRKSCLKCWFFRFVLQISSIISIYDSFGYSTKIPTATTCSVHSRACYFIPSNGDDVFVFREYCMYNILIVDFEPLNEVKILFCQTTTNHFIGMPNEAKTKIKRTVANSHPPNRRTKYACVHLTFLAEQQAWGLVPTHEFIYRLPLCLANAVCMRFCCGWELFVYIWITWINFLYLLVPRKISPQKFNRLN